MLGDEEFRVLADDDESRYPNNDELLGAAAYLFLYKLREFDLSPDGWNTFYVFSESVEELDCVGSMDTLEEDVPVELHLLTKADVIQYRLRWCYPNDKIWSALTDSECWKAVYFYASERRPVLWEWREMASGKWPPTSDR